MVLTLPAATRAAVFHGPDDLRLETVPLRAPGPGEALVRIRACGLCSSETLAWYMRRKAPLVLGHEPVGEVVAAGEGVALEPGARVFVHHHAPCLRCRACRRGQYVHCPAWQRTRLTPGGLCEYALVPAEITAADMLALPPGVGDEAGVFVEPLACVVKSLRRARVGAGDRVAVIGLGVMGLLHLLLARRLGVEGVVGVDLMAERLAAARAAGADEVVLVPDGSPGGDDRVTAGSRPQVDDAVGRAAVEGAKESGGDDGAVARVREATDGGADVVFVTPASLRAVRLGYQCVAPGGRLVIFTPLPPEERWPLPLHDLFFREVELVPTYSAGPDDTREALRVIAGGLPVEALISHRLGLEQVAEGYRLVAEGRALKVVVRP